MIFVKGVKPGVYYSINNDTLLLVQEPYIYGGRKRGREDGYFMMFSMKHVLKELKAVWICEL